MQGIAKLRKAEIRRMGEKGQQFITKQEAKKTGVVSADEAVRMLTRVAKGDAAPAPVLDDTTAKGLKGFAARAKQANAPEKMSATSLLLKGVNAAEEERQKERKTKEREERMKAAAAAPAAATATPNKRLSFGEYMARADGAGPSGGTPIKSACKMGQRGDSVGAMVQQGVTIKRSAAGPTTGPIAPKVPKPATLQPGASFANDVKMLTQQVGSRSGAQNSPSSRHRVTPM